jgi:hypothetical protein
MLIRSVADPDPACHFDADPDPAFHFDADPYPSFLIKKKCSNRLILLTFWLVICKLMRIRIQLITLIRIQLTTLMRIRIQILLFNLMRIRNHNTSDPDSTFTLILIRIRLFTLMRIRIQFSIKVKKESATFGLHTLPVSSLSRHGSIASLRSSRIFTLMRIRIKLLTFMWMRI